jgi:NADH dehydrogenase (ubiquinone) 1 beta subcomplex subunit 8
MIVDHTDVQILGALGAVGAFGYFLSITRIERPVAPRSYPYGGLEKELGGRNAARIEEESMDE